MAQVPSTANHLVTRARTPGFLRLSNDTIVDHIFSLLSIRDVLRLRQVCKLLYELTHQPAVWKRFLRNFHLPLPPLPPTMRYSMPSLSSFETERLLLRALSADANWRSPTPYVYQAWRFPVWNDVLHMKMLPGGKHMVVSVRNGPNHYELLLLMMDHRVKLAYPVASFKVPSKAYKLEARYMQYNGEMGIVIAYERREAAHKKDRMNRNINVSEFSDAHDVDFPVPLRYELGVLHARLSSLDVVEDPRFPPGSEEYRLRMEALPQPFEVVTTARSNTAYDFLDIDEIDGDPHLICTQDRCVITKNLATKWVSRFRCAARAGYEVEPAPDTPGRLHYHIRAIRILPSQRELLIVAIHETKRSHPVFLELYRIPSDGELLFTPGSTAPSVYPRSFTRKYENAHFNSIHISHHGLPLTHDLPMANPHAEIPPVSIFGVTQPDFNSTQPTPRLNPWLMIQYRLWPERVAKTDVRTFRPEDDPDIIPPGVIEALDGEVEALDGEEEVDELLDAQPTPPSPQGQEERTEKRVPLSETTFRFNVQGAAHAHRICFKFESPTEQTLRFLPGTVRSCLYGVDAHDRSATPCVVGMYTYVEPAESQRPKGAWPEDDEAQEARVRESEWIAQAMGVREEPISGLSIVRSKGMRHFMERGLRAIEWEDWSGRLCMVNAKEPETIHMLEYAMQPHQRPDGHRHPVSVPDVDEQFR